MLTFYILSMMGFASVIMFISYGVGYKKIDNVLDAENPKQLLNTLNNINSYRKLGDTMFLAIVILMIILSFTYSF